MFTIAAKRKKKKNWKEFAEEDSQALLSDPHWQADLVLQGPDCLLQCALENQEQASTPLLQREQSFHISKLVCKRKFPGSELSVAVLKLRCTRFIGGGRGVFKMWISRPHSRDSYLVGLG